MLAANTLFALKQYPTRNLFITQTHADRVLSNADRLLSILESAELVDYFGEPVSQQAHALQCANLAKQSNADEETILAALFHDIGHLCESDSSVNKSSLGVIDHDVVGAHFLKQYGMSDKVCRLVLGHVQAKRYLTYINPAYFESLSDASKATLALQGGPMTKEEAIAFETDPLFSLKIKIRNWDEQAKVIGLVVPNLASYRPLLLAHLARNISH